MTAARRRSRSRGAGRAAPSTSGGRAKAPASRAGKAVTAGREAAAGAGSPAASWATALGKWSVWGLALVPPFLVSPTAEDAFRLAKTLAAETLALFSLLALAIGWWSRRGVSLVDLARREATVLAALLTAAVLPGAIAAIHPLHWQRAMTSLAIALACLVMWSARLDARSLRRALDLLLAPAAALALLAVLQARDLFRPFEFALGQGARFQLTSLAGSVGDLAAYLVLPALVAQAALLRARTVLGRAAAAVVLGTLVYTIVVTETLAALAAVVASSLVFWAVVVPWRRLWLAAAPLAVAAAAGLLVPGLGRRVSAKLDEVLAGRFDSLLSGRPDGWKASLEMFREHPWFGVGHGGYGSSFAPTKLALVERGVAFWSRGRSAHFANAHNDYLEALAEWGLWGAVALVAALVILARRLRGFARDGAVADRALALAGCAACAVLALASFPLRIALTAYPWLLLLAWIFAEPGPSPVGVGGPEAGGDGAERAGERGVVPARAWSAALCLVLAPVLVVHVGSLLRRLEASRIVRTTSQVAQLAVRNGAVAARPVLQANLPPLVRAARLDPLDVGVALTTGSHHLLLGDTATAIESYQRGLAVEPRSELYLNLARALALAGRHDEAVARAADAVTLDPQVASEVAKMGLREPRPSAENERAGDQHERRERRDQSGEPERRRRRGR